MENNIRKLRNKNNLTLVELADVIGISKSSLSRFEKGEYMLKTELIKKLCTYFKVSSDYLLGITNNTTDIDLNFYQRHGITDESKINEIENFIEFIRSK